MIVQIYEVTSAEEARALSTFAVDHIGAIWPAHFVSSLYRTLCRTLRFLAIFDEVGRQSA
jgi:hypothetical protein